MAGICDTCHAGCCRSYHLFVTAFDAFRISRDLGLPVGEFVTLLSFPTTDVKRYEGEFVPIRFGRGEGAEDTTRYLLALKKIESHLFPGTEKCYFLNEWKRDRPASGREGHPGKEYIGRCSIYGSRPMVCRTYPTSLHQNVAVGLITTPPPIDLASKHEVHKICPEEWTVEKFGVDPTVVLHNLAIAKYEREFYNQAVTEFNESGGALQEFFPFMSRVYEHRFRNAPRPEAKS
jgi:Fe-S-cluster containining protein